MLILEINDPDSEVETLDHVLIEMGEHGLVKFAVQYSWMLKVT